MIIPLRRHPRWISLLSLRSLCVPPAGQVAIQREREQDHEHDDDRDRDAVAYGDVFEIWHAHVACFLLWPEQQQDQRQDEPEDDREDEAVLSRDGDHEE